jgi:hypothetical protein
VKPPLALVVCHGRPMGIPRSPLGFYGDDTNLICVMSSGRIWLVERPEEGPDVLRELYELPRGVESHRNVVPREIIQGHLVRIATASGESF